MIESHDAVEAGFTMAVNKFADLTREEFKATYLGLKPELAGQSKYPRVKHVVPENFVADDAINWQTAKKVSPVKDQGNCGSCWAFSAVGALEGAHAIATGKKAVQWSEQELNDCSDSYGNMGCQGGLPDYAYDYVIDNGLTREYQYPYVGTDQSCKTNTRTGKLKIGHLVDVSPGDEDAVLSALKVGPLSVGIEADQYGFQFYSGGIIKRGCGNYLDHGVLIVGYDTNKFGKSFWRVKNSWGKDWGEKGYVRIAKGLDECGIADLASYPVIDKNHAEWTVEDEVQSA